MYLVVKLFGPCIVGLLKSAVPVRTGHITDTAKPTKISTGSVIDVARSPKILRSEVSVVSYLPNTGQAHFATCLNSNAMKAQRVGLLCTGCASDSC